MSKRIADQNQTDISALQSELRSKNFSFSDSDFSVKISGELRVSEISGDLSTKSQKQKFAEFLSESILQVNQKIVQHFQKIL